MKCLFFYFHIKSVKPLGNTAIMVEFKVSNHDGFSPCAIVFVSAGELLSPLAIQFIFTAFCASFFMSYFTSQN